MEKKNEYVKNTLILMLGKFCTQFMTFLLLPLYTRKLLTEDYGYVDLIQTYILLFVPILILRMDTAIFRFLIDERKKEDGKKSIISSVFILLIIEILFVCLIYLIVAKFINIRYKSLIFGNTLILMLSGVLLQTARGLGRNKEYSIASIITGFFVLLINCILILKFNFDARSILISSSFANIICCLYIFISCKLNKYIKISYFNKTKIKNMLNYSLPMIPNALSWWVVNVSDRTLISIFMSNAYNGIYSVSCKFSNILNSIFTVFNMSWQETASLHINDEDRDEFLSDMINKLWFLFIAISILIITFIPILFDIVIGNQYRSAYNYIPILLIANIFNILISLVGGIYVALKKTKEIANTTIISAVINFVINIIFIRKIGLYAASFSTLIAYLIMSIYRIFDVKKYIKIKIDTKKVLYSIIMICITTSTYYFNNVIINLLMIVASVSFMLYINKEEIILLRNKIISNVRK